MSQQRFGKTWWGKKWIEALESIDKDTNRLPRGRSYAKDDAVKEIKTSGKYISAKVKGSSKSPYSIKIELVVYKPEERKRVENLLRENPSMVGEFSVGKISENVQKFFDKNKIQLFPNSWDEINATCTCPDWANPCKHRAAVYYLLANEIDKNPTLLLEWRGVDVKHITGKTSQSKKNNLISHNFISVNDYEGKQLEKEFNLSFQISKTDIHSFFDALDDNPVFYPNGNFKSILKKLYFEARDNIDSMQIIEAIPHYLKTTNFYFVIPDGNLELRILADNDDFIRSVLKKAYKKEDFFVPVHNSKREVLFEKKSGLMFSVSEIVEFFSKYPLLYNLNVVSESARFISLLLAFSSSIIQSLSHLPQLEWRNSSEFKINYFPVFIDDKTRTTLGDIEKYFDPIFGFCNGKKDYLLSSNAIQTILKNFTDSLFRFSLHKDSLKIEDKIISVFRDIRSGFVPEDFKEEQIGKSVENWLERLSSLREDITPLIMVDYIDKKTFCLKVFLEKKNDPLSIPIPISDIFEGKAKKYFGEVGSDLKLKLIRQILLAGEKIPELLIALNNKGEKPVTVNLERLGNILTTEKPMLEFLGIRFLIPKELKEFLKPKLIYEAKSVKTIKYIELSDLQRFTPKVTLAGKTLSDKELKNLLDNAGKLIPFRDGYILIDPKEAERLFKESKERKKVSKMEMLFALLTGIFNGEELELDKNFSKFLEDLKRVENTTLPKGLEANLRPYQKSGFEWMYSNLMKGIGPCIADDMGLGKTLQVIAVLLKLKEDNKLKKQALVACPTSLLGNWKKEIERFAPTLKSCIYHGNKKILTSDADVMITTYAHIRVAQKYFSERPWDCFVIDEAQNIKNPLSEQSKAAKLIKANYRIAMSGTPVENRLTELWSIFDFTNPNFLGELYTFKKEIAMPIEKYRDEFKIRKLKIATSPFMIRRLKTDKSIISDLPEKIISNEYPQLSKEQEVIYTKTLQDIMSEIEVSSGITRRGLILKLITCLKQICNHPSHFSKKSDINPELSGKTIILLELLEKILDRGEKTLIFTQYAEMGRILQKMLAKHLALDLDFFEGSLSRVGREKMIKQFQENENKKVLIISLKAGGTGLNLVNATNVIHYDLWWNPAVEDQATDRAFRIGQTKNVQVHRFITMGTFEEKIDDIMKQKRELANLTVSQGEKWITEMSNKELKSLFALQKED
jgi:SNF2 family DNA or RNA helicase/uncharacterized Zn finger protein